MNLKLVIAVAAIAVMPVVVHAQQKGAPPPAQPAAAQHRIPESPEKFAIVLRIDRLVGSSAHAHSGQV